VLRVCWRWTCVIREAKNLRIPHGLEGYVSVDLAQEGEDQMREVCPGFQPNLFIDVYWYTSASYFSRHQLQLPFMDRIKDRIRNMDENITVRREVSFLEVKDSRVPSLLKSHLYWSSLAVFARMPLFKECRPRVIILDGITLRINELEKYRIRAAFERGRRVILRGVRVLVYPRKKGSQTFDEEVRNPLIRTIGYMMANPFACGGVFGQAIRHLEAEEVRHPLSEFERHQITQIGKTQIGKSVYPDHTQAYVMLDGKHEPWATW